MRYLTRSRPGLWRLAAVNTVVMAAIFVVLAASPAPVHFPSTHWEALMLAAAALLIVILNLLLAAAAMAQRIERGRRAQTETPDMRDLRLYEHFDVYAADGAIGLVDEVLGDRTGRPRALVVSDGWFGARRFLVPIEAIAAVDAGRRALTVEESDGTAARARSEAAGVGGAADVHVTGDR